MCMHVYSLLMGLAVAAVSFCTKLSRLQFHPPWPKPYPVVRELRKRITEQASRHEGPKTHDDVILQRPEGLASPRRHSQQMRDFKSRPSHHGVRHRCCHQNCIIVPAIDGR
uniref:Secreted protein n=1 Tax=Coccidioides posadasii RMSCC 3488 TaxID=454284 RepID=A0A0J6FJ03_COCPO|nr:hypothetical protein CPAG_06600 [Coccidioides posadasii RMSCC 3488]